MPELDNSPEYWDRFWTITGRQDRFYDHNCGPRYPKTIPGTERTRKKARTGGREERLAHGQAVLDGIGKLNAQALGRGITPAHSCPCPSGSWSSTMEGIFEAIGRQNAARLTEYWIPIWQQQGLTEQQAYDRAIAAKRKALAAAKPEPVRAPVYEPVYEPVYADLLA